MTATATALAESIRRKQVSSLEVVETHLRRIEQINPKLNAVVQLAAERARAEARAADAAVARGESKGSLHGVPVTIKNSLDSAGIVSTGGTRGRASFVPKEDATVVARLCAAGAIVLGKTNTPELTAGAETDNRVYGRTNNPYDPTRTPGGSSGGAGAIVAAGGSPLDLGSDTSGSIRLPWHFYGIAGIKPTSGRVPRTGHILGSEGVFQSYTQIGPLARSVDDLVLALQVISGPDGRDPYVLPVPLGDPSSVRLRGLRVAWFTDSGVVAVTAEIATAVQEAVRAVGAVGMQVREARPPDLARAYELGTALFVADGGASLKRALQAAGTRDADIYPPLRASLAQARAIPAAELTRMIEELDLIRGRMLAFMDGFDAVVSPVNAVPAVLHGTAQERVYPGLSYTAPYNVAGWPAVVVRGGTSAEGLPIGVQVAARPWREDVALAVAKHLETALGGWRPPAL